VSPKEEQQPVEAAADLGNPRETQSILAYIVTVGFFLIAGIAIVRASTFQDIVGILNVVAPLAVMVLAFYFANKAAQAAQAAAEGA